MENNMSRIFWTVLVMALMSALKTFGASTTQPTVYVRDAVAGKDTTIVVHSGDTLYLSQLPAKWTLDYDFGLAVGHTVRAAFMVDAGAVQTYEQPPYNPIGHNVPISLAIGPHIIALDVNSIVVPSLTFNLANAPPATQPTPIGIIGTNAVGMSDPAIDFTVHPTLLTAVQQLDLEYLRIWIEGGWNKAPAATYFKSSLAWSKYVKVIAVANFQNSTPRCSAPSDAVWVNYWTAFPPPSVTGIYAICIGNETDTVGVTTRPDVYWNGTNSQLFHLLQLAYPILHKDGYIVVGPSQLRSLDQLKALNALGAAPYYDAVDRHFYSGTAVSCLTDVDDSLAYGTTINKLVIDTEGGVRNAGSGLPSETQKLNAGLRTRKGVFCLYPLYIIPNENLDIAAPLTGQWEVNQSIWNAFLAAKPKQNPNP